MTDSLDANSLEALVDDFTTRLRRGERPSVSDFADRYPQHADEIRALFPSIAAIERFKRAEDTERQRLEHGGKFTKTPCERIGEYEVVRQIGRGGMGIVLEARQESLGRNVALKVLSSDMVSSPKRLERFRREAKAAAKLHHTNIVPVFGVGEHDGTYYYVMQLIDGLGLDKVIHELRGWISQGTDAPPVRAGSCGEVDTADTSGGFSAESAARALFRGRFGHRQRGSTSASRWSTSESNGSQPSDGHSRTDRSAETDSHSPNNDRPESGDTQRGSPPLSQSASDRHPVSDGADRRATTGARHSNMSGSSSNARQVHGAASGETEQADLDVSRLDDRYWRSIARIGLQAADAIQHAHTQGVMHRDIKPANLLLDKYGMVWVTDFGLAKSLEQENVTNSGDLVGTLRYMAPEQINGHADAKADIYSLGITLFELLTLRPAFGQSKYARLIEQITREGLTRPRSLSPAIPRDLETIVLKAAALEPRARYDTAGQMAEDLQRFLDDRPISARRTSAPERLWRWCRRNPSTALTSGAALLFLVLVAVVATIGNIRTNRALARAKAEYERAEMNLALALQAFENIIDNISVRGVPHSFELHLSHVEAPYYEPYLTRDDTEKLRNLRRFFEKFAQQNAADLKGETAEAYRRVGEIYQRLGQFDAAAGAYSSALQNYNELSIEMRRDVRYAVARSEMLHRIGKMYVKVGHINEASDTFRSAIESLLFQPPDVLRSRACKLALAENYIALVATSAMLQGDASAMPGDEDTTRQTTSPFRRLRGGAGSREISRIDSYQRNARNLLEQLVREDPVNPTYRLVTAQYYRMHATVAMHERRMDQFSRSLGQAILILERLSRDFPNEPSYRVVLADTLLTKFPHVAYDTDEPTYRSRAERAVDIAQQLQSESPHTQQYRALLALSLSTLASIQYESGETDLAEENYQQAIKDQHELAYQFPDVPSNQVALARSRLALGDYRRKHGQLADSKEALQQAVTAFESFAKRRIDEPYYQQLLKKLYISYSQTLTSLGNVELGEKFAIMASELADDQSIEPVAVSPDGTLSPSSK